MKEEHAIEEVVIIEPVVNTVVITRASKSNKYKKVVIVCLLLLILIMGYFLWKENHKVVPPIPRPGIGQVDDDKLPQMSDKDLKEYLKKRQDASNVTLRYSSSAIIMKGSKKLNLYASNSVKNSVDCFIELLYKDTSLYKSAMLKPSQAVKVAELSSELPLGESKLIARYHFMYKGNEVGVIEAEISALCK